MPNTPLVSPDEYFARGDAFALRRAVAVVLAYWLATTALDTVQFTAVGETGAVSVRAVTPLFLLQMLEATLLYWVVPTVVLFGVGIAVGAAGDSADYLALAAWVLVPLLAGEIASYAILTVLEALAVDSAAVPVSADGWLFAPLTIVAGGWIAFIWRDGLRRGSDLDRSAATATAVVAAAICAVLWLFWIGLA